jgi:hypothetical protein
MAAKPASICWVLLALSAACGLPATDFIPIPLIPNPPGTSSAGAASSGGTTTGGSTSTGGTTGSSTSGGRTSGGTGDAGCPGTSNCCTPATSQTIYANSPDQLFTIDPVTWTPVLVGSFLTDRMTDIAVSPNGDLYTVSLNALYSVDPNTALATLVMNLNSQLGYDALTFLPDGTLLAVDGTGQVIAIDLIALTTTILGSYGDGYSSAGDVVAVADGTLYGVSGTSEGDVQQPANNVLLSVDPKTAIATAIGSIGLGEVYGLAYYGGTLLAFTGGQAIARLDPATGEATVIAYTQDQFWGAGITPLVPGNCP